MWQTYYTPTSIDQALRLLSESGGRGRIIAGGTDLLLELERHQRPGIDRLIDISRIPGLDRIEVDDQGWVHIGPMVTHNHCAGSKMLAERAFALAKACWQVGAPQIRNRGTLAGNVITASPANDSITPLMAFGAWVRLRSQDGERLVPLEDFYTGVRRTVVREGEVMTDIAFALPSDTSRSGFYKVTLRRAQAISLVNVAMLLEFDGALVSRAAVTLGAVAPTIIHAREAESFLVGKTLSEEVIEHAGELAAGASKPIDDIRSSAKYRKEMVRVATMRVLRSISAGAEKEGFPAEPVMLWGADEHHVSQSLPEQLEHTDKTPIDTVVNGKRYVIDTGQSKSLLRFIREDVGLTGSKEGCAEGECGACTVFLDGVAVMSCLVPAPRAHGADIVTIEGLAAGDRLHPLQRAFIEEGAVQCGYCTPGLIMSGVKLLEEKSRPSRQQAAYAITGNLCRCTGYYKILSAIERAAEIAQSRAE